MRRVPPKFVISILPSLHVLTTFSAFLSEMICARTASIRLHLFPSQALGSKWGLTFISIPSSYSISIQTNPLPFQIVILTLTPYKWRSRAIFLAFNLLFFFWPCPWRVKVAVTAPGRGHICHSSDPSHSDKLHWIRNHETRVIYWVYNP